MPNNLIYKIQNNCKYILKSLIIQMLLAFLVLTATIIILFNKLLTILNFSQYNIYIRYNIYQLVFT